MRRRLEQLLPRSHFVRSVSFLAGGTALGQLIVISASPLLTRLYSPADYGLLAVYSSILAIVSTTSTLCYQFAVPVAENDQEAAHLAVLAVLIALTITSLSTIIFLTWSRPIAELLNIPRLRPYLWLIPFGALFSGVYAVLSNWAIRTRSFPAIGRTRITQALSSVIVQVAGSSFGPLALLLGQLIGQASGNLSLLVRTVLPRRSCFLHVRTVDLKRVATRWRKFPVYTSWSSIFNITSHQLPPVLFALLFSPAVAGVYMLAHRVLNMPMQLLGQAIASVFYSGASIAKREGKLASLVSDVHAKLAHIAMPPTLILMVAGPDLFGTVFGSEWRISGEFARWMAPWLYLAFISSPLSQLFFVLEKQAQNLALQMALLGTRTLGIVTGAILGDEILAVGLFAVASVICYSGFLFWIMKASGNSLRSMLLPSLRAGIISLFISAPVALSYFADLAPPFYQVALTISGLFVIMRYSLLMKSGR